MKTLKCLVFAAAAIFAVTACNKDLGKDIDEPVIDDPVIEDPVPLTEIFASQEETKVAMDGPNVNWVAGDAISVLYETDGNTKFSAATDGSSVTFTGDAITSDATDFYAVYPYSASYSLSGSSVTVAVPSQQKAIANGVDPAALPQAGKLTVNEGKGTVAMKNVCALFKLVIEGSDIASATISGNNNENLAGEVTASIATEPSVSAVSSAATEVKLVPASGSVLAAGTYYLAVLPQNFTSGFSITYVNSEGKKGVYTGSTAYNLQRAHILPIGSKESEAVWESDPEPEIVQKSVNMSNIYSAIDEYFDVVPESTSPFTGYFGAPLSKNDLRYVAYADNVYKYTSKSTVRFKERFIPPVFAHKHLTKVTMKCNAFSTNPGSICKPDGTVVKSFTASKNVVLDVTFDETLEDGVAYYIDCNGNSNFFNIIAIQFSYEGPDVEEICAVTTTPAVSGTTVDLAGSYACWNYGNNPSKYTAGFEYKLADAADFTNVDATVSGQEFSAQLSSLAPGTYKVHAWARLGSDIKMYGPDKTVVVE